MRTGTLCKLLLSRLLLTNEDSVPATVRLMAGFDLISDEGFRIDGRRPNELRRIQCKMGVYSQADGSAYIEQGNTKVLATVYGPHEVTERK